MSAVLITFRLTYQQGIPGPNLNKCSQETSDGSFVRATLVTHLWIPTQDVMRVPKNVSSKIKRNVYGSPWAQGNHNKNNQKGPMSSIKGELNGRNQDKKSKLVHWMKFKCTSTFPGCVWHRQLHCSQMFGYDLGKHDSSSVFVGEKINQESNYGWNSHPTTHPKAYVGPLFLLSLC